MLLRRNKDIPGVTVPITPELMKYTLKKQKNNVWEKFVDIANKKWVEKDAIICGLDIANSDYDVSFSKKYQYLGIYQAFQLSLEYILRLDPIKREIFDALPDKVTIFRGGLPIEHKIGANLNWSLSRSVAESHAFKLKSYLHAIVYKATIDKNRIMDIFDKGECEIIALISPEEMEVVTLTPTGFTPVVGFYVGIPKTSIKIFSRLSIKQLFIKAYTLLETDINFSCDSVLHGIPHALRVMYFCLMIGDRLNLPDKELEILSQAAIFHDTRRINDGSDSGHGFRAESYYKQACIENAISYYPEAALIIRCHDMDDCDGNSVLLSSDIHDKSKISLLYSIFKDADALDRFRLGDACFDASLIRTDAGKGMIEYCKSLNNIGMGI